MKIKLWKFLLLFALLLTVLNFGFFKQAFANIDFSEDAFFGLSLIPTFLRFWC
ncbi:MAG: hypothetical protein MR902_09540 [Campylobacter sp.]|nr:hypothetical protein [Campylobacter sp.]